MKILPRSLYGRMLLLSGVATIVALAIAAFAIARVLERFVIAGIDDRLETSITMMRSVVGPDGKIDRRRIAELEPTFKPDDDWQWAIDAPGDSMSSTIDTWPDFKRMQPPTHGRRMGDQRFTTPFDMPLSDHSRAHGRWLVIDTSGGPVTLIATAPRWLVERPIGQAIVPLLATLAILGVLLAVAAVVQLRIGLRPLARLRSAIGEVRSGAATHVPEDQPDELRPLATELNALIGQNAAALSNARGHVANLAHGLKTPLATLSLGLAEPGADPSGKMSAEVARIDGAIRHHLGRARADAAGAAAQTHTAIAPALDGLVDALARIHADRAVAIAQDIAPGLAANIDAQDLDELLGNLLDNAWRWAASRIAVSAHAQGRAVVIEIADDGPGITPDARAVALAAGQRLDERGDGYGFGLAIARELAELHGGSLALGDSALGGLSARVTLTLG